MSTTARRPEPIGIDDDFELLEEQIAALKELARLDDVPEGQAYDFGIRWGAALAGRFRRLVHYSCLGVLDEPDERRFQSLCDDLRSVSELIERFDLARPRFTDTPSHPTLR
ncbi:hypothetical protein JF732_23720 [Mycobacterium intracellulare]|uniref:Uncharacterized protein n=1 Tax=Mycobacterium intracellulare TaxID=1767 RepID=A0AAE4RGK3_MYCIT|nr:hypothetical protein [Mycobacterium intracellulare]MCA2320557.1 hypothetical protein [Mycobacterium intracellulare]MCA2343538.1 hypothetical protein [Mycobacterium intracellulare]MDV6976848.1 hypothetical protein [Mycobacterium intracellulare]MDV6981960.1 hypothetical protein [Mycobacterium intracellulare]MDV7015436.1 hypothetical protein [Mycobacterium intracellulare]